jgi:hypothetical protein
VVFGYQPLHITDDHDDDDDDDDGLFIANNKYFWVL